MKAGEEKTLTTLTTQTDESKAQAVPVTADNFNRAESDMYFASCVKQAGGLGKFFHNRVPLEECQRLAALHQYELFYRQEEDDREQLVTHIDRVLAFLHAKENEPTKLSVLKRLFNEIVP
jgi:hypothetical protein